MHTTIFRAVNTGINNNCYQLNCVSALFDRCSVERSKVSERTHPTASLGSQMVQCAQRTEWENGDKFPRWQRWSIASARLAKLRRSLVPLVRACWILAFEFKRVREITMLRPIGCAHTLYPITPLITFRSPAEFSRRNCSSKCLTQTANKAQRVDLVRRLLQNGNFS